jgi:Plasma-membrane choline transporter
MRIAAGAIIFTVIALLSILSYVGLRSRIPLASLLLQVVMDIAKHHKAVYAVALTTLLLQAFLSVYGVIILVQYTSQLIFSGGTRLPLSLRMSPESSML